MTVMAEEDPHPNVHASLARIDVCRKCEKLLRDKLAKVVQSMKKAKVTVEK
jgi:hypothetical protein